MRTRIARLAGVSAVLGALTLGLAVAPASAVVVGDEDKPLVVRSEDIYPASGYVVSADQSKMYVLRGEGNDSLTIDLATHEIIGSFAPVIDYMSNSFNAPRIAAGEKYAAYDGIGYALVTLGTEDVEYFGDDQGTWPYIVHMVADESGKVTAFTGDGTFLEFTGSSFSESSSVLPEDRYGPYKSGVSADGMLYFESYATPDQPDVQTTAIIDMRSGTVIHTVVGDEDDSFEPIAIDASGTSIWGIYSDDFEELVNINWVDPSASFPSARIADLASSASMYIDGENDWYVEGKTPALAGQLSAPATLGERWAGHFSGNLYRVPATGDLVYYDIEMRDVGIVVGPKIAAPQSATVTAIGQTVSFSALSKGLATGEADIDEQGVDSPELPFGSIWQSSPDGVTWTDIAGEVGPTLTLAATAENLPLQFRRHFLDGFWGEQNSAAAQMIAQGPEITRADDLPNGQVGKTYPSQIITAVGQPGMTWSSADLPAGLTLNASTGEITGTAPQAGDYEFTVKVTDDFGTDSKLFHLKVTTSSVIPPVTPPTTTPLPNTGADGWGSAAGIAVALLALGAAGLLVSRRRPLTR